MLPSALVAQLERGMKDFLRTSFWSTTPGFDSMIERFLSGESGLDGESAALFKGPYVSVKLPFRTSGVGTDYFPNIPMRFPPYMHQYQAFERLSGEVKKNTIVATGTGSGKTESFLYPVLEHCARFSHKRGVKAILIYPMNALAQDQAERVAGMIWENENLRGKVSAGLYVGSQEKVPHSTMGPAHILTDKEVIRSNPPDILLTNYKMLDYLLARPRDQQLWAKNDDEMLRFLVVDELHTFDGAQGTDLACLIRRLKARLLTPPGHLCCVGTSATLGGSEKDGSQESGARLIEYAEAIFGEKFGADAVIKESRQSMEEFVDKPVNLIEVPAADLVEEMNPERFHDTAAYSRRQQELWFGEALDPVELGEHLKEHMLFQNLVRMLSGQVKSFDEVVAAFGRTSVLRGADERYVRMVLISLMALISGARRVIGEAEQTDSLDKTQGDEGPTTSLVQAQIQLWQREMRRMVATVGERPALRFYDDLTREQHRSHLPIIYCRDCGLMGWATMVEPDRNSQLQVTLKELYRAYFSEDDRVRFFFPRSSGVVGESFIVNSATLERSREASAEMRQNQQDDEHAPREVEVVFSDNQRSTERGKRLHTHCPACGAKRSLSLLGFQAATLTSTYINQLYASGFNDDKKLLTFSDSVQDAAHRAGFFGARTWQFNLRVAIQKVVDDCDQDAAPGDLPLGELPSRLAQYWREQMSLPQWVATFIAPDMMWLREWEKLKATEKISPDDELIRLIERRLSWEVFSEYTLRARIGRTLPRSAASVAYVDPARVSAVARAALEPLRNEIGGLRDIGPERLRKLLAELLVGFLRRMIEHGAVFQPELHESYLETGGKKYYWQGKGRNHMPNFGSWSRLPTFLASRRTERFEALSKRGGKSTWYDTWFARCMEADAPLLAEGMAADAWRILLDALIDVRVLEQRTYGGTQVWGLRPEALYVTKHVARMRCSGTGEFVTVAEAEREVWEGMPSLSSFLVKRSGIYEAFVSDEPHYYANLYRKGDVQRIVAEEHTGLLERDDREELERRFKSDAPAPWYPNLLSCTPTLEMGIDIGDLSSAILCSVPPTQANYLQRIGRAGRRDGNSLLLTLAAARPHDLFFFEDPEEMIDGQVDTPGVFLNASAVLERQLTAYCMDCWASSGVVDEDLPARLGKVFEDLNKPESGRFPHNFLRYIQTYETKLLEDFLEMFAASISDATREHLTHFMRGSDGIENNDSKNNDGEGSLRWKILDGLHGEKRAIDGHAREVSAIDRSIKNLEAEKVRGEDQEKDLDAMRREKSALTKLIGRLNARQTMNFFTDEGLLPNYAFPEAGVTLKSIIWRKRSSDDKSTGKGKYESFSYEYQRPARSAIRELAPRNHFYAGGRQVSINRVDVAGGGIETWQFCDNCHYAESNIVEKSENHICPACGSPGFGNAAGQKQRMHRLRQVYANTSDRDSRIGDDREERQPKFYNEQMLVSFADDDLVGSWCIDDDAVPFGYEYIRKTTFREINFGEYSDKGEKLSIGGVESIRQGFEICVDCGMIQPTKENADAEHTFGCPSRRKNHKETIEECLFLYREFRSEAIRMLLPFVDRPGYQAKMQSFVAALQMGLKDYFAGEIAHLETTVFSEPSLDDGGRKQFLVIYDTVPGGTGYLKELIRGEGDKLPIFEVFRCAWGILASCSCNRDPDKDGCYRCLYAYRNSYDMPETSRDVAREVLSEILEHEGGLKPVESLGSVSVSGLFDSALEARFVEALRRQPQVSVEKHVVDECASGFRYRHLGDEKYRCAGDDINGRVGESVVWNLLPQQVVRKSDGVAANAEIDLLFRYARSADQIRDIAAFTDGLQYHGDRVGRDMFQRMALVRSGQYRIWSLTWHDVEAAFSDQEKYFVNGTSQDLKGFSPTFFNMAYKRLGGGELSKLDNKSSLTWLKRLLREKPRESEAAWKAWALAMAVGWLDPQSVDSHISDAWRAQLSEVAPLVLVEAMSSDAAGGMTGCIDIEEDGARLKIFVIGTHQGVSSLDGEGIRVLVWLDDRPEMRETSGFRRVWNGYLRLYNLMQFLPECFFITSHRQDEHDFSALVERHISTGLAEDTDVPREVELAWEEMREHIQTPEYIKLVDELLALGAPLPEAGYELCDERDWPTDGLAELAWPDIRFALIEFEADDPVTEAGREAFEQYGWKTMTMQEAIDDVQSLYEQICPE